ncbi:MAG: hypothetical protein PVI23_14910, partial [Maricaulaceae bacterium]
MARCATSAGTRARLTAKAAAAAIAAAWALGVAPLGAAHAQGAGQSGNQAGSDAVTAGQTFRVNTPLYVNGDYAGDLTAELTLSGLAAAERLRLIDLLDGVAADEVVARVSDYEGAPDFVSLEALRAIGLDITYDASAIALNVILPLDERAERIVSFAPEFDRAPGELVEPSRAALGLGIALSQDYYHESATHEPGLDGLRARIRGGANLGGVGGLNLAFETFFDDGAEDDDTDYWRRGDVVLFNDIADSAVRFSVGDINPVLTGVQSAPGLGGIGVQRLYNEIQPLQNVRPAGRTQFTLERDSTVEVLLNGVPFRTLRLPAGRYDIRDLPFTSGLNDVVIVVEDETGVRREIASFSQFLDFDLLSRGISEFEAIIGVPTTFGDSGNEYDEQVAFTGFYRRGITDRLTLGVHGQGSDGFGMIGFESAVSTPIGVAFGEIVASGDEEFGGGYAANLGLTWNAYTPAGQRELALFAETESEDFISLSEISPQNPRIYEVSARARTPLPGRLQLSLAGSYAQGRNLAPDETRGSITLSKAFGRANMFVSYEHTERGGFEEEEDRILASLVYRFGGRQLTRARYDSFRSRTSLEWERQLRTQAGDWGARLGVADQESGPEAIGELSYFGNRFEANLFHDYLSSLDPGAPPEQLTSYDVEVGVGVAGGRVAVGRDAS